jgi:hypothetical protein
VKGLVTGACEPDARFNFTSTVGCCCSGSQNTRGLGQHQLRTHHTTYIKTKMHLDNDRQRVSAIHSPPFHRQRLVVPVFPWSFRVYIWIPAQAHTTKKQCR